MLMHAATVANPLSQESKLMKAATSKRSKTEQDHLEIAKLDWYVGFYKDADGKPIVPSDSITGMLISSAKKLRCKNEVAAGIYVMGDAALTGHGHKRGANATIDDFWGDGASQYVDVRGVVVSRSRIMRYRPIFKTWSISFDVELYNFDVDKYANLLSVAGQLCGLGDFRPRFGTFTVDSIDVISETDLSFGGLEVAGPEEDEVDDAE
jgi:hypothetical protein